MNFFTLCFLSLLSIPPLSAAEGKSMLYQSGSDEFEDYLAMPKRLHKSTPGILLVHDW